MKQYKIGDFSKNMWVTPDFLKHYEQYGILEPSVNEAGYRYYPFNQAARVIECIRYRNWGFSVKEINELVLQAGSMEAMAMLEEKFTEIEESVLFRQDLLQETRLLRSRMADLRAGRNKQWFVAQRPPFYFLPQTQHDLFLEDAGAGQTLRQWMCFLPMVKSQLKGTLLPAATGEAPGLESKFWGFAANEETVRRYSLATDGPVEYHEGGRFFEYHVFDSFEPKATNITAVPFAEALQLLARLGLKPRGNEIHLEILLRCRNGSNKEYLGTLYVPLAE